MAQLSVTLIDVGWGDSILVEIDPNGGGEPSFGLVDCNDTTTSRSAFLFIKRRLERRGIDVDTLPQTFEFVLLTHGHADHAAGIQSMISYFRTNRFWYPKSVEHGGFAKIIRYANRYDYKVRQHQAINSTTALPSIADVRLQALWPPYTAGGPWDDDNENNNSVVLALTLNHVTFLLTGDCEAGNWDRLTPSLAGLPGLAVFQVPHHGAFNGLFDSRGATPWLDALGPTVKLAMSSHIRPHHHPALEVVNELEARAVEAFRTDLHYHLTFSTDGTVDQAGTPHIRAHWSHV